MRNSLISICVCFVAILCTSCSQTGTNQHIKGSTYSGIIPCADCSGIAYELTLNKDYTYSSFSRYLGKSLYAFTDSGKWEIKNDTHLVLGSDSSSNKRMFVIEDRTLKMADQEGKAITGQLADHYELQQKSESTGTTNKKWNNLRDKGIDFRADGAESFWKLRINMDSLMTFNSDNQSLMQVAVPELQEGEHSKARILKAKTGSGSLKVKLYPTGCLDTKTRKVFPYGVVINSNNNTYRGCGDYISPKYQLYDFWTLRSIKGSTIADKDFLNKTPALNFDLSNNRISGNTGCNSLSGDLTVSGDSLSFGDIATTKMACHDAMEFENRFLKALGNVNSYTIDKGFLKLMGGNNELMVFQRSE